MFAPLFAFEGIPINSDSIWFHHWIRNTHTYTNLSSWWSMKHSETKRKSVKEWNSCSKRNNSMAIVIPITNVWIYSIKAQMRSIELVKLCWIHIWKAQIKFNINSSEHYENYYSPACIPPSISSHIVFNHPSYG